MTEDPAHLLGVRLAADGHPRLGASLILQEALGLRPSELLGIQARDVHLPSSASTSPYAVIGLGVRTGTKAKRAQCVLLRCPKLLALLAWLVSHTNPEDCLVPYSYEQYRRLLIRVRGKLGITIQWTPHSPRSGFASDCIARGLPFRRVKELGRWSADQSLKAYVDIVMASSIGVSLRLSNLNESMAYAIKHALTFFVGAEVFLAQFVQVAAAPCASDHASGRLEDGGSVLLSTFAGLDGCEVSVGVREIENFEVEYSPVEDEGHGGRGRARGGGTAHEVVRGSGRGRGSQ